MCVVSQALPFGRSSVSMTESEWCLPHAESDKILGQDSDVAEKLKLPDIFGATEDDTSSLRIVSLYEVSFATPLHACSRIAPSSHHIAHPGNHTTATMLRCLQGSCLICGFAYCR